MSVDAVTDLLRNNILNLGREERTQKTNLLELSDVERTRVLEQAKAYLRQQVADAKSF
jgi:hypothetical protein